MSEFAAFLRLAGANVRIFGFHYLGVLTVFAGIAATYPVQSIAAFRFFGEGHDPPGWVFGLLPLSTLAMITTGTAAQGLIGWVIMRAEDHSVLKEHPILPRLKVLWVLIFGGVLWTGSLNATISLTHSEVTDVSLGWIWQHLVLFGSAMLMLAVVEGGVVGSLGANTFLQLLGREERADADARDEAARTATNARDEAARTGIPLKTRIVALLRSGPQTEDEIKDATGSKRPKVALNALEAESTIETTTIEGETKWQLTNME